MNNKILITGGSSGIGKGIAEHFYHQGWYVLITGRNPSKLEKVASELPGIHTMVYHSSNEEQLSEIIDFINEKWEGALDILVNNGGHVTIGGLGDLKVEYLMDMYKTHLVGPSILTSRCLEFLKRAKGQVLNVTSSHGIKAYPQTTAYGSAKAGLNMLTRIWALELAPLGIRVNAIAPGPTNTDILKSAGFDDQTVQQIHEYEKEEIPLKRRGEVADVVENAIALIGARSTWITGVVLPADGGISIS